MLQKKMIFIKVIASTSILILYIYSNIISVFAVGPKVHDIFKSAGSGASSGESSIEIFIIKITSFLVAWTNALGAWIPILAGIMVTLGIVIALITSFSKKLRGIGLSISGFALLVFILWLFLPTLAHLLK